MKLEKKKIKDHVKMAKKATGASKAYHVSHLQNHKKNVKDDQMYMKKVSKLKVKAGKKWMDIPEIILASLAIIVGSGVTVAYFARSRGSETIRLLQVNIQSYKDAETLKDARINALEVQLQVKDDTIKELLRNAKTHKAWPKARRD